MLRKFSKKNPSAKQSKRGVILVTILFILAISFILITAAMLMTKATRDRLYTRAESSQARLTATAVAQAFQQAYSNHTISEGAMRTIRDNYRNGTPGDITDTNNLVITIAPDLPGLTSAADNCTTLTVIPNPSLTDAYWYDFTTTIGTEKSTVRLSYKHHDSGTPSATFQHQLQLGSGGRLENIVVGTVVNSSDQYNGPSDISRYDAENNTVLSLGGSTSWGGQTHIASTLYCDSPLGSGSNTQMYGDVVFFGENSGLNLHGLSGSSFHGNNGANLYFLDANGSVLWYDSTRIDQTNITDSAYGHNNEWICGFNDVTFYNSGMHVELNQNIDQSGTYYTYANGSANDISLMSFGATNASDEWNSRVGDYSTASIGTKSLDECVSDYVTAITNGHYNDTDLSLRPNGKTFSQFLDDCDIDGFIVDPSSLTGGTPFPTLTDGNHELDPGTYILGGSGASSLNIGAGNKVECDLSKPGRYIFYVVGDFTFRTGTIEFTNGNIADVDSTAYFVIAESASLRFIPYNCSNKPTGIVDTNCFSESGPSWSRTKLIQTSKPSVMVIGAGCTTPTGTDPYTGTAYSNRCIPETGFDHVRDGQIYYYGNPSECVMTAYVNLLPKVAPTTTAPSNGYGSVCGGQGGNAMIFYGRIYCNQCYGGNGSCLVMPYCPAPSDDVGNTATIIPNDYDIYGFSYYTA